MKRLRAVMAVLVMAAAAAWAGPSSELVTAIRQVFVPAEDGRSLVSSQIPLDMAKVRGFAVIKKGGIPAGQAYWFITHQDYEYRPFIVKGDAGKTYLGKVEVVLPPGTIMVVSSADVFQKSVEIKLLSKDVIAATAGKPGRRDTRAAVAMVFKFPELSMTAADAPAILAKIEEFVAPADSLAQAELISSQIQGGKVVVSTPPPPPSPQPALGGRGGGRGEGVTTTPSPTTVAVPPPAPSHTAGVVRTGMKYDDVKRISGEPKRTITRGNAVVFDYGDHEVIFIHEEVQDVRWK